MVDSVSIKPLTGNDKYGQATYGTEILYDCFVSRKRVVLEDGENSIISNLQIYIDGNPTIGMKDLITYDGVKCKIKYVQPHKEKAIAYSTVIYT